MALIAFNTYGISVPLAQRIQYTLFYTQYIRAMVEMYERVLNSYQCDIVRNFIYNLKYLWY